MRRFDVLGVKATSPCPECGSAFSAHGWIGTLEGGHRVCPGDWIIEGIAGEFYPCKPDIFSATYEPVEEGTAEEKIRAALMAASDQIHELDAEVVTMSRPLAVLWAEITEYLETTKEEE